MLFYYFTRFLFRTSEEIVKIIFRLISADHVAVFLNGIEGWL